MGSVELPKKILKRLDKYSESSNRSVAALVKQAVQDRLDYEDHKLAEIKAAEADVKMGRVYGKAEFWGQLQKARNERKKTA